MTKDLGWLVFLVKALAALTCFSAMAGEEFKPRLVLTEAFTSQFITSPIEYQLNTEYGIASPNGLTPDMGEWKALDRPASFLFEDWLGWIRIPVINESSNSDWVLELDWPKALFKSVEMFYKPDSSDQYVKIKKDLRHRFFTWRLKLDRFESGTLMFRAHAPESLALPIRIYKANRYALETNYITCAISFFISIILSLAIFNLFIGLRTKDQTHLWYSLAQFGIGWFFAFYYGLDHKLYPDVPNELIVLWIFVMGYLAILGMFLFILNYMDFRHKYSRLYPYVLGMIFSIFVTVGLYGHIHTSVVIGLYFLNMGGTLLFILGVALYGVIKGDRLALYFLLIWVLVAIFLAFFDAQVIGLIERTLFTNHSILIGFALEALLFSFALGERINALIRANYEAETSAQVKSDFLAQMSHEIRTPMNSIIGMSQLMELTELEKKQRFYNNLVQSSAESLLCIINDILDFSKIEAGKLSLERIPFSLHELLQGVQGIFYSHVERTKVPLYCSVQPLVPDELVGDPSRLRQILINLVGNAFKFTADGYILLSVSVDPLIPGHIKFSIRDSGVGISTSAQAKLFSAFSQVDASTSRKYGGTGLGLAISKNLSALMGGNIGVESKEGVGSCFYFTAGLLVKRVGDNALSGSENSGIEISGNEISGNENSGSEEEYLLRSVSGMFDYSLPPQLVVVWSRSELCDLLGTHFICYNIRVIRCDSRQQLSLLVRQQKSRLLGVIIDEELQSIEQLQMLDIIPSACDAEENEEIPDQQAFRWILLTGNIEDRPSREIRWGIEMCRWGIINRFYDELVVEQEDEDKIYQHSYETKRSGLRVLVAEDILTNQEVIRGFMAELGHEINVVENGIQAVQDYQQHGEDYDLILMDCSMPEMDGFEATREIRSYEKSRKNSPPALIVALTAHAFSEHREQCMEAGMNDHLSKPITLKNLVNTLNRHFPEA